MLVVDLNRENFEYDVNALVKAFYPEEQVKVLIPECKDGKNVQIREQIRIRICLEEDGAVLEVDGKEFRWSQSDTARVKETDGGYKDGFKRFLYSVLSQITGKKLPWGNLTGIRPTKIALTMLEEGKSEQEILRYYQEKHYVTEEKARLSVDIAKRERELLSEIGYADGYSQGYSLYIGIPFCPTTCLYCSFTSFPIAAYRKKVDAYIDCLIREMEYVSRQYKDRPLDSVYIGGGTPTTLEAVQLDRLLTSLRTLFDFSNVKEFTVEAGRADSITEEKLAVLYRQGVTRISINPQTMKQETLDIIGRNATVEQVENAYVQARKMGFDNINMDLILGLPGETQEDVQYTMDRIMALAPDSLTVHSLAVKRASRLNQWLQEERDVAGKVIAWMCNTDETMRIAADGAKKLGLVPYYLYRQKNMAGNFENVGYAREGKLGLYNVLIMEEKQTIIALGAGSISKRVYPDGRIERSENVKEVALYMDKIDEMIERKRKLLVEESFLLKSV